MSIRVFAHDANTAVDRHLCTKNRVEVIEMIRTQGKTAEQILDFFHSTGDDSSPSITDSEMRANVGEPDGPGAELTPAQILRAETKLRAWPYVGDELATRVAPVAPGA